MANEFRFECKRIISRGRNKNDTNISEELCRGLKSWLQQNDITLIENDKGRATCLITTEKRDQLIKNELDNQTRYKALGKDNIEKVKSSINKELASLRKENLITKELMKELKQITPITPRARPTLKSHKNPLKCRLIVNTRGSAFY